MTSRSKPEEQQLTTMLRAIADPARRRILALLKQPGYCAIGRSSGMCACDVEGQIGLSQPTISHHMAVLRKAGLVEAEKIEQWMWYRRNEKAVRTLAQYFRQHL
ncbi:MAG TPA: metalloregulator ArsR/SmtB family transcription factor [Terriglobales bacterium]|nr:metalloregulator ArsR/SmtB family transcription factor [Terriglobales bacterium]